MTVILDHTIVLSPDKLGSALFLGYILDRPYAGAFSRFAPVQLDDELCIDYADADSDAFERRTFTLLVDDAELRGIVERLDAEHVPYGPRQWPWPVLSRPEWPHLRANHRCLQDDLRLPAAYPYRLGGFAPRGRRTAI